MIKAISLRDPNEFATRLVVFDIPLTNNGKVKTITNRLMYDGLHSWEEINKLSDAINTVGDYFSFKLKEPSKKQYIKSSGWDEIVEGDSK